LQSQLLNELLNTIDAKMFTLVLQLIIVGAVFMWIKDMNSRIVSFLKLRLSDFGRGTKVKIDGIEGFIHHIGFDEVEIIIDSDCTMLVPVDRFIKSSKIIITHGNNK